MFFLHYNFLLSGAHPHTRIENIIENIAEGKRLENIKDTQPAVALRNTRLLLQAGLRTHEWYFSD
jgi:hypothetical protein